ncbi:MAG: 4-(cytidine 5'-diphospho)-2-C-methyl-D-erythritol kinase [Bacteroidales bacterium]|nr:4-(cytidine 5'-diphospho)-2-C-methyl-D-erythritol kinase [Bacteroidales bacterium]
MLLQSNAKINIGLYVTAERPDGYHDIETLFYPLPLCDVLEMVPATDRAGVAGCRLDLYGHTLEGPAEDNLCVKAYRLLQADFNLPPVDMALVKLIPAGGGLGGGSSDATATLKGLNTLFDLGLSEVQLGAYAGRLGSDCAFFVRNEPAIGRGRGELLTPFSLSLKGYYMVLAVPSDHVSTAEAYRGIASRRPQMPLEEMLRLPVEKWRGLVENDFERTVFPLHPGIAMLKECFYRAGAVYASMTGSGAGVYSLFREETDLACRLADVRLAKGFWL